MLSLVEDRTSLVVVQGYKRKRWMLQILLKVRPRTLSVISVVFCWSKQSKASQNKGEGALETTCLGGGSMKEFVTMFNSSQRVT